MLFCRKCSGPEQTTASWLLLFHKELSKHVNCNANDHNKAKLEPLYVMQITTDISPVQFEPPGSPNCVGPLITALPGAAAAGWLLMNPHWQTFSSPKNTVMSSHSAMWSQPRLPSASVVFAWSSQALYGCCLIPWGYNKLRACRRGTQPRMCTQTCRKH